VPAMLVWDHLLRQIAPCDTCRNGFRCYTVTFTISFFFPGFVGFSLEEKKKLVDICSWEILSPRACNYYQPHYPNKFINLDVDSIAGNGIHSFIYLL
jgi:hypothetical protein